MNIDSQYVLIGTFIHTRGVHGQLVTQLELSLESLEPITFIFIQVVGKTYVPYKIEEKILVQPDRAWLQLQYITSKEAAHSLLGKNVWLQRETFEQLAITSVFNQELIGYETQDLHIGKLGVVMGIEKFPTQDCLVVEYKNQELLIPYVSAFIKDVEHEQKHITLCLPSGFLEALGLKS